MKICHEIELERSHAAKFGVVQEIAQIVWLYKPLNCCLIETENIQVNAILTFRLTTYSMAYIWGNCLQFQSKKDGFSNFSSSGFTLRNVWCIHHSWLLDKFKYCYKLLLFFLELAYFPTYLSKMYYHLLHYLRSQPIFQKLFRCIYMYDGISIYRFIWTQQISALARVF